MYKITLNGTWTMNEVGKKELYDTKIPGSVLSGLLEHKVIEDPYVRENEYAARELFWNDYEFQREFEITEENYEEDVIELVCYGLDTIGEVYVNELLIGSIDNMHRTWRFPIKNNIKIGKNNIRILFKSTLQYIEDYEYEENKKISYVPCGGMRGNQLIRKAHSMFGWDWGAQLPDAGIFRDIELEIYSEAKMEDVIIEQIHEEEVALKIRTEICKTNTESALSVETVLIDPSGTEIFRKTDTVFSGFCEATILVETPKLWWPNGFGEQPLYEVRVCLRNERGILEEKEYKIGLRTLTVSQEKDQWGSEFALQINGIKIFTKGANYIPEDCIYSNITKEKIQYLVESSVRANYNCLRVWGGGYYPSDLFYELCDQYGLIVWQDLMYACNVYDVTEAFEKTIVEETKDNVRRLRHHACLGLWCGNNEIESAWDHWGDFQKESEYLRADYTKQFEYILPKAVKEVDQNTFYWPSSPSSGGCFDNPDDENRGDTHYWAVWHGQLPFSDYQNHFFRFCSEFGFQSFPSMKTVKTYTEEEDRNIFSKVMESHQKNAAANGKMLYYLSENFRYPKDFEHLLYVTQILQGIAIKSGVEHFRRNRGRCMGSLYWQINDNWPVASWSSIDYYGRWKALHYMAKNFYAPVAASLVRHDYKMEAFIQNESLAIVSGKATLTLKKMDFTVLHQQEFKIMAEPLSAIIIGTCDYKEILKEQEENIVFVELKVVYEDGSVQVETETFLPYKYLKLENPNIKTSVIETKEEYIISLQTHTFANYVELDFASADVIFEDNYFALTSPEIKEIRLKKTDICTGELENERKLANELQIRTIADSYL